MPANNTGKLPDPLDLAREAINEADSELSSQVNCETPEWRALKALQSGLSFLELAIRRDRKAAAYSANVASCIANGIQPD